MQAVKPFVNVARLNNFSLTLGFSWSYTLLLKSPADFSSLDPRLSLLLSFFFLLWDESLGIKWGKLELAIYYMLNNRFLQSHSQSTCNMSHGLGMRLACKSSESPVLQLNLHLLFVQRLWPVHWVWACEKPWQQRAKRTAGHRADTEVIIVLLPTELHPQNSTYRALPTEIHP